MDAPALVAGVEVAQPDQGPGVLRRRVGLQQRQGPLPQPQIRRRRTLGRQFRGGQIVDRVVAQPAHRRLDLCGADPAALAELGRVPTQHLHHDRRRKIGERDHVDGRVDGGCRQRPRLAVGRPRVGPLPLVRQARRLRRTTAMRGHTRTRHFPKPGRGARPRARYSSTVSPSTRRSEAQLLHRPLASAARSQPTRHRCSA